jgi:uncharacterized membrane protein YphA (DoxX/SURF4 family)
MTGIQGKIIIVLRILFGLVFLGAGVAKIAGVPIMVQEFDLFSQFGIGQWFRYLVGAIEIVGALLLISPRTVLYGAGLLFCVSVGAFIAQVAVIHQDFIHTIVFAVLIGWVGWSYRGALTKA